MALMEKLDEERGACLIEITQKAVIVLNTSFML